MSTIKSSDEHLTLNADGSSKDIKLQANASEKVIVKSDGKVGIGVSSPAVTLELAGNGGAVRLPNGGEVQFGNANNLIIGNSSNNYLACKTNSSERMRIDSAGNVGIGATSPARKLHLKDTGFCALAVDGNASANSAGVLFYQNGVEKGHIIWDNTDNALQISGQASNETDLLKITSDGRGLSQFTAKAWVNFQGSGTVSINDHHNVSSITDNGTGNYTLNLANNLGNGHGVMSGYSIMDGLVYGDASGGNNVSNAGNFRMRVVVGSTNALMDSDEVHCIVFGD